MINFKFVIRLAIKLNFVLILAIVPSNTEGLIR